MILNPNEAQIPVSLPSIPGRLSLHAQSRCDCTGTAEAAGGDGDGAILGTLGGVNIMVCVCVCYGSTSVIYCNVYVL